MRRLQKFCLLWLMFFLAAVALSSRGDFESQPVPQPRVGEFFYQGQLQPVARIQVERVHATSELGRRHLEELKSQRFSCHHVMRGTYRCSRQSQLQQLEDWAVIKVENEIPTRSLRFPESDGSISLIHDAEGYKSWKVERPVETDFFDFDYYFWSWTPEISKIVLKHELQQGAVYFNLDKDFNISMQFSVRRTLDKNRFETHIIRAHFTK